MRIKLNFIILIIFFFVLLILFTKWEDKRKVTIEEQGAKKNMDEKNILSSIHPDLISLKKREEQEINVSDINIVAATVEEAEQLSSDFYNDVFSIYGLENGYINKVSAGKEINVYNFFNSEELTSQFIPLYVNNKIVAVSIFREYNKGENELGRMSEIHEEWYLYPPITPYEAEAQLISNFPILNYTNIPGYYYIEDGETPYYLYKGDVEYVSKYYLVSAYNKEIVVKDSRSVNDILNISVPPAKMTKEGFMAIDENLIADLSNNELNQLRSDIELTNEYIKNGIMKFDEKMNILYDGRHKEYENKDIFSSDAENQYNYINDVSDDAKMDNTEQLEPMIE